MCVCVLVVIVFAGWCVGGTVCAYIPRQQWGDDDVRSAVLAET